MATVFGIDHKTLAMSTVALSVGVAAYSTYRLYAERRGKESDNVYESRKLLNEYLVFHFGTPQEVLKYDFGPKDSLDFPRRCAELCLKHYRDNSGIPNRALDIGCAVGRSTFELCRVVEQVVGIDYSQSFVDACNALKTDGKMDYFVVDEGDLTTDLVARVAPDIDRSRAEFQQGDACALRSDLGKFGIVLAANLICRLHHATAFLQRLPGLVASGGVVVITAPYTWLPDFADKVNWLGGYKDASGNAVTGFSALKKWLSPDFDLLEEVNMPFFIRETARKNQWTVAHATVWRRK
ncbi:uncharacterized protein [Haliotis cracherodii]|uniref:uncharacterized protein n=1 Tax=Haliotis cracherodii TaxID=6455 RepID=UPI0039ECE5C9